MFGVWRKSTLNYYGSLWSAQLIIYIYEAYTMPLDQYVLNEFMLTRIYSSIIITSTKLNFIINLIEITQLLDSEILLMSKKNNDCKCFTLIKKLMYYLFFLMLSYWNCFELKWMCHYRHLWLLEFDFYYFTSDLKSYLFLYFWCLQVMTPTTIIDTQLIAIVAMTIPISVFPNALLSEGVTIGSKNRPGMATVHISRNSLTTLRNDDSTVL